MATVAPNPFSVPTGTHDTVTEHNQGLGSLLEFPTTVICSNCATVIAIPAKSWCWTCSHGHPDNVRNNACKDCKEPCPGDLPWPAVECAFCKATTVAPSTEIAALLKGGVYSLKSAVKSLVNGPSTFHCMICNTLLMIPRGSWKCQACTTMNAENIERCVQCAQDRLVQSILCGSCGKSTSISKSGVLDSLRAGMVDLEVELHRSWLDLTGQPYVACAKCQHAVKLPSNLATTTIVTCNNCMQSFRAAPSTGSTNNNDSGRYVNLSQINTQLSQNQSITSTNQSTNDFKLTEALSNIDETTAQFSSAPKVNTQNPESNSTNIPYTDQHVGRIIYQPTDHKDTEVDLVNSYANSS